MTETAGMAKPGDTLWHTSDVDGGGPDVGIEVRLSENQRLYAGEVPGSPGWCIALRNGSDRTLIAVDVHAYQAREMIEAVAAAIKASGQQPPAPVKPLKWHLGSAKWGGLHYHVWQYANEFDRSTGAEGWLAAEHTTGDSIPGLHPNEEAAMAAAQTHFDDFIRSALEDQA